MSEKTLSLTVAGESHKGCVRAVNEDNFCYVSLSPGYLLAVVADGVGGHSGGDIASYLCCHRFLIDWKKIFKQGAFFNDAWLAKFLDECLKRANMDIFIANMEKKSPRPMCTTVAAMIFTPERVLVAHVGDSRVYCCRKGVCRLLTVDHTVLNDFFEKGVNDPSLLPGTHVISKAVGSNLFLKPELHSYMRCAGDRFLICSDGLTNHWDREEIGNVLMESDSPKSANDQFIRNTLRRGAVDNVTVVSIFS